MLLIKPMLRYSNLWNQINQAAPNIKRPYRIDAINTDENDYLTSKVTDA